MIPYVDKLKVIFHSTQWPEGVAGLMSHEDKLKFKGNIPFNIVIKGGGGF